MEAEPNGRPRALKALISTEKDGDNWSPVEKIRAVRRASEGSDCELRSWFPPPQPSSSSVNSYPAPLGRTGSCWKWSSDDEPLRTLVLVARILLNRHSLLRVSSVFSLPRSLSLVSLSRNNSREPPFREVPVAWRERAGLKWDAPGRPQFSSRLNFSRGKMPCFASRYPSCVCVYLWALVSSNQYKKRREGGEREFKVYPLLALPMG